METKTNAMGIHGATDDIMLLAYEGIVLFLVYAPVSNLHSLVLKSPKSVHKKLVKKHVDEFENSKVNLYKNICCNRGTNFIRARSELQQAIAEFHQDKQEQYLRDQEYEWKFNPSHVSHFGGTWE